MNFDTNEVAKGLGAGVNEDLREGIEKGLAFKKETYGEYYCPCVPVHVHNPNVVCPCKAAREYKACHCGLFKFE